MCFIKLHLHQVTLQFGLQYTCIGSTSRIILLIKELYIDQVGFNPVTGDLLPGSVKAGLESTGRAENHSKADEVREQQRFRSTNIDFCCLMIKQSEFTPNPHNSRFLINLKYWQGICGVVL